MQPHLPTSTKRPGYALLPLTIASLFVISPAQADDKAAFSLPNVQVTAEPFVSATEKTAKETGSVSVVDAQQLNNTVAYSAKDLFRYDPSILTTSNGRFGLAGFNVRGLDDNRISIQLDGVEMAENYGPSSSYLDAGRLSADIASLSSASVVKGGNAQQGSGFSSVALRLHAPQDFLNPSGDDTYASVQGGYRSDSEGFFQNIKLAARQGDYESLLVATHRDGNATENYHGSGESDSTSGDGRTTPDPGDVDSYDVLVKIQKLNDLGQVGIVAQKYRSSSELRLFSLENARYGDYSSDDTLTRARLGLYQDGEYQSALFDAFHWQIDWQRSETVNATSMVYNGYNRVVERDFDQTTWQLKTDFSNQIDTGMPQQVAYGLTLKRDDYTSLSQDYNLDANTLDESRFSPPGTATRFGLYLQDRLSLADERGSLTPALRFDHYEYDLDNDNLTSQPYDGAEGQALTGQVGGTWNITSGTELFGKTGIGFRAPSYEELYYDHNAGRGYRIVANPDLDDEHSHFAEFGIRKQGALGSAEFTGFYTDYRDFIESSVSVSIDPTNYPIGEFTTDNVDRAIIRGAEFKGQLNLHQAFGVNDGWYARTAAAYIEGKNLDDGGTIESIPPIQAVAALGYEAPDHRWGSELAGTFVNHVSAYDAEDAYAPSAYQLYDLTGHMTLGDHLTVRGGVFNLLDKQYWVWDDVRGVSASSAGIDRYTQPGRNVGISAEYVF
ncbi:ligand-gated channel [Halovibrio variabilis]|uniref:Ligand-gated channel n=1 Tax=Halovibrio variabilis TaxID=31910 RepID=A0A511UJ46_9GAMM|nr:TonB-dependent hemoglobin/transferrin/lactoferrin family receptor [Halovibrio variabilis]GEN26607.1 ligand-gated channel [Halovibrio variabilis]